MDDKRKGLKMILSGLKRLRNTFAALAVGVVVVAMITMAGGYRGQEAIASWAADSLTPIIFVVVIVQIIYQFVKSNRRKG